MPGIPSGCRCSSRCSVILTFVLLLAGLSYTAVTPEVPGEQLGSPLAPAGPSPG